MRIIGIDPGSRYTGYGVIQCEGQHLRHLASGRINATSGPTFADRLQIIYEGLTAILAEWPADQAAVEAVFTARNALSSIKLGHARGVALLTLIHTGLPIHEYPPALVKKNVAGQGRATKEQIQKMVQLRLNLRGSLSSDAADALAVAICHSQATGLDDRFL
jgi:crossover junction endodeoxyribonuclease RuvC